MSNLRDQFEAWYKDHALFTSLARDGDGYKSIGADVAWDAYQAGHAASGRDELLEACEQLLAYISEPQPFTDAGMWEWKARRHEAVAKANAAIKKARGET